MRYSLLAQMINKFTWFHFLYHLFPILILSQNIFSTANLHPSKIQMVYEFTFSWPKSRNTNHIKIKNFVSKQRVHEKNSINPIAILKSWFNTMATKVVRSTERLSKAKGAPKATRPPYHPWCWHQKGARMRKGRY